MEYQVSSYFTYSWCYFDSASSLPMASMQRQSFSFCGLPSYSVETSSRAWLSWEYCISILPFVTHHTALFSTAFALFTHVPILLYHQHWNPCVESSLNYKIKLRSMNQNKMNFLVSLETKKLKQRWVFWTGSNLKDKMSFIVFVTPEIEPAETAGCSSA